MQIEPSAERLLSWFQSPRAKTSAWKRQKAEPLDEELGLLKE